jgi:hypothetical protein
MHKCILCVLHDLAWGEARRASAKIAPGRCAWWGGQAQPDRLFQKSLRTKKPPDMPADGGMSCRDAMQAVTTGAARQNL